MEVSESEAKTGRTVQITTATLNLTFTKDLNAINSNASATYQAQGKEFTTWILIQQVKTDFVDKIISVINPYYSLISKTSAFETQIGRRIRKKSFQMFGVHFGVNWDDLLRGRGK